MNQAAKRAALFLIKGYRYSISPLLGQHCRYYPSCSSYTYLAIERYGVLHGSWLGVKRLLRCHPWHEGGYDPVPEQNASLHQACCHTEKQQHDINPHVNQSNG